MSNNHTELSPESLEVIVQGIRNFRLQEEICDFIFQQALQGKHLQSVSVSLETTLKQTINLFSPDSPCIYQNGVNLLTSLRRPVAISSTLNSY